MACRGLHNHMFLLVGRVDRVNDLKEGDIV